MLLDVGFIAEPVRWLGPTERIDSDAPGIAEHVARCTEGALTDRERALRIYRFVRDEVAFGWQRAFYDVRASDVLAAGRGYCNTKGPLFVAMLRAAGIPARLHFIELRSDVLSGIVDTGGPYVDHAFAEVYLGGRWVGVDSYVVDPAVYREARRRLMADGRLLGYGIHRHGSNDWDGIGDSFVQYVQDGSVSDLSPRDHGVFNDVDEFYERVDNAHDRLSLSRRIALSLFLPGANRRLAKMREAAS